MEGGCTCGEVRFRLTDSPLVVHCCHCTWCQRQTGSAFVVNAWIETDRVELLSGEPVEVPLPTPSGGPYEVARCPTCQTALWGTFAAPVFRFVRVGTLDDPAALPPDVHIYTSTKVPWLSLGDAIPVFEDYYRRSKIWRPDAVERFRLAKESIG
ncbi:MAG: GFA family protein [Paracoccaceae bacterium]|nr:GFA family protein [Paracoccaceae bacterium]